MSNEKITQQDFENALKDMNTYVDVSVQDLMIINRKAEQHARFRLSQTIQVAEFMTEQVITIAPDETVARAAELMLNKHIAGIPIVDLDNGLIGIFTEADLLASVGVPRHKPHQSVWSRLEAIFYREPDKGDFSAKVCDLMVKNVVTIKKNETLGDVLLKMNSCNVKRLVVTEDNHVIGIVTRSNLLRIFLREFLQLEKNNAQ